MVITEQHQLCEKTCVDREKLQESMELYHSICVITAVQLLYCHTKKNEANVLKQRNKMRRTVGLSWRTRSSTKEKVEKLREIAGA